MEYDVFISHASEDKSEVALPLARYLQDSGLRVWLDRFELTVGDSIRRNIERGLLNCRFGIVILSPSFFKKEWPQKELDSLFAKSSDGSKVILPVWHNISKAEVSKQSPLLADILAVTTNEGIEAIGQAILRATQRTVGEEYTDDIEFSTERSPATNSNNTPITTLELKAGGALPSEGVIYVQRNTDRELWSAIQKQYGFATILAMRLCGKTSLLIRLGARAQADNWEVAQVDICAIGVHSNLAMILFSIACVIADQTKMDDPEPEHFLSSDYDAEKALQAFLLGAKTSTLILFDETEGLETDGLPVLFRVVENITKAQLRKKRGNVFFVLALAPTATWVKKIVEPFIELGYHTRLPYFTEQETRRFFEQADMSITDKQLAEVYQWTGGHPFLVQWSGQKLQQGEPLQDSYERAALDEGFFLWYHDRFLESQHYEAIYHVLMGKKPSEEALSELIDLGILKRGAAGITFTNYLYETHFSKVTKDRLPAKRWWPFKLSKS